MIEKFDEQIKELNRRISEMASDFADMLKDTLSKMQDRIEFANKGFDEDAGAEEGLSQVDAGTSQESN